MNEILPFVFPGMMVLWLYFIAQTPMTEVLSEQRAGTLARLMSTPLPLREFLIAKIVRAFILCFIAQCFMVFAGILLFQVDWGNPFLLLGIGFVTTLAVVGLIALIYAFCSSEQQVNAIAPIFILTLGLLGGSMFPYEGMPDVMKTMASFTPNRWAIYGYQTVIWGNPVSDLIQPTLILLGIGIVSNGIALMQFQRRLKVRGLR